MPFKYRTKRVPVYVDTADGRMEIGYTIINDTRRRWRAIFWWIVVFTLVTFFGLYNNRTTSSDANKAVQEVSAQKADLSDIHRFVLDIKNAQSDSCKNYEMLRDAVNLFTGTLDGFLAAAQKARLDAYKRTHVKSDKDAADVYTQLRAGITIVKADCAQHNLTPSKKGKG